MPTEQLRDLLLPITFVALFALGGVIGVACWGIFTDLPDRVGAPVLIATVFVFAALAMAQRLGLRVRPVRSKGGRRAEPTTCRHPSPPRTAWTADCSRSLWWASPERRRDRRSADGRTGTARAGGLLLALEELRICGMDLNGDGVPEAMGSIYDGSWGFDLTALDRRGGARVASLNREHGLDLTSCKPPFLAINYSNDASRYYILSIKNRR